MDQARILIAGAGPVGLSLALGLARRGASSVVLERKSAPSRHSKAVLVTVRTVEILHDWGLLDRFKSAGQWIETLTPHEAPSGREVLSLDFHSLRSSTANPGVCIIPQNETERLLLEACQESGLVDVRYGCEVSAFDATDDGVRVRLTDGSLIESEYLCGCDGAHSTVRDGLGLNLEGRTYPAHAILADFRVEGDQDRLDWPRIDLHADGFFFCVRFGEGLWRLVLAERGDFDGERVPDPAMVHALIHRIMGPGPAEVVWSSTFRIHCRNVPQFRAGRVVLLGDAAHLNSPAGGQGMNAGVHDAHNLAWKLAAILHGAESERLLKSYDQERFDAVTNSVDPATDRLTRIGVLGRPWVRHGAIALARMLTRFEVVQRSMASSLGMISFRYDKSECIDDSGGKLLPDVDLGDGLRLRTALGPDGGLIEIVQGGRKICLDEATYELSGLAMRAINRAGGPILAVRPDHVIAYSGGSREAAGAWLPSLGATGERRLSRAR